MTSAPSQTSPFVSVSPHEDGTLLRIALDRPKANVLTMAMTQVVVEVLNVHRADEQLLGAAQSCSGIKEALGRPLAAVERLYLDRIPTSRDGDEGIYAVRERRKPVWEAR